MAKMHLQLKIRNRWWFRPAMRVCLPVMFVLRAVLPSRAFEALAGRVGEVLAKGKIIEVAE